MLVLVHVWTAIVESRVGFVGLTDALIFARDVRFRVGAGGQHHSLVHAGEIWRLWTGVLLHADALHLGVNAVSLYALGRLLEPWLGPLRLLAWFLLGGVGAAGLSHVAGVVHSDGASGGAFALLGAAVVLGWERRARLDADDRKLMGPWLWGFLALNLVLSVVLPGINLVGHLGGLLLGLMLGGAIGTRRSLWFSGAELVWVLACAVMCVSGWAMVWRIANFE